MDRDAITHRIDVWFTGLQRDRVDVDTIDPIQPCTLCQPILDLLAHTNKHMVNLDWVCAVKGDLKEVLRPDCLWGYRIDGGMRPEANRQCFPSVQQGLDL